MNRKRIFVFMVSIIFLLFVVNLIGLSETMGEKNALRTAKNYLSMMGFSYTGLIQQLEFEGYTKSEATYAADHCGADWKENALKTANNYLSFMGFSYDGLIDQLKFEGYTHSEAVYAANIKFDKVAIKQSTAAPKPTKPVPTHVPVSTHIDKGDSNSENNDLSRKTFKELLEFQKQLNSALWNSKGWQKVVVPPGVYIIGVDIPAERWTIAKATDKYTYFRIGKSFKDGEVSRYNYTGDLEEPMNLIFEKGTYLEVLYNNIVFTPYESGLGFIFE